MHFHSSDIGLPPEVTGFHWTDLERLAKYHRRMAENFQKRAARMHGLEMMQEQAGARADALAESYTAVLGYLKEKPLDDAIAAAAAFLNAPEMTIRAWWNIFLRHRDAGARARRNAAILQFGQAGLTNGEIAGRFGVSCNTVSRIVSAQLCGEMRPADRLRLRKRRKVKTCLNF